MADNDPKPGDPESEDDSGALMYVRCSVCGEWLDVKPGKLHWVSHGLCSECHESEMTRVRLFLEERRKRREITDCAAGGPASELTPGM